MIDAKLAAHLSNRIAFGPKPGDIDHIRELGLEGYLDEQLNPQAIPQPASLTEQLKQYPTLSQGSMALLYQYAPIFKRADKGKLSAADLEAIKKGAKHVIVESAEARLAYAVGSDRQLYETMVEFWMNHFNVYAGKGLDLYWPGAYEREAVRPHALGRFSDLLLATAKHPAMLFYLDNWLNTAPGSPGAKGRFKGINENYAREVMELHTLGVDGGYTQKDVTELARVLTGWTFIPPGKIYLMVKLGIDDVNELPTFTFDDKRHDSGSKVVLGRTFVNNGYQEGVDALMMLARHPATAKHISYQLAQYYVADEPDPALVASMAETFTRTDGDIRSVLRTMFTSPQFLDPANFGTKFKTPHRFVVSAVRASGVEARNMLVLLGTLRQLGQTPFGCQTPDGYKCTRDTWLSPDAITRRIAFAVALGAGKLPLGVEPPSLDDTPGLYRQFTDAQSASPAPLDTAKLMTVLGDGFSARTRAAISAAPAVERAGLVLGSPEFMSC